MYTKSHISYFGKVVTICFLILSSLGCSKQAAQISTPTFAENAPLADFILGEWHSIKAEDASGEITDAQFEIIFETKSEVDFIVIYLEGGADGDTFTYSFITSNSIFVDNKRILGGETWLLERKDGKLIVTRTVDKKTMIIELERGRLK